MTSKQIVRADAELRIVRRLRNNGAVSAVELKELARPFDARRLLKSAREDGGVEGRGGHVGGLRVANAEKLDRYIAHLTAEAARLRVEDVRAVVGGHLGRENDGDVVQIVAPILNPDGIVSFPEGSWQAVTITALVTRFNPYELYDFLPDDFKWEAEELLRCMRYVERDIKGPEVAHWLVVLHGRDLLANERALRDRLAHDADIKPLARFHTGSPAARAFVEAVGLPPELAGLPDPERLPSIVQITSARRLPPLVDYQVTASGEISQVIQECGAAIYSVPTGGGKTRTAWESVRDVVDALVASPAGESRSDARNIVVWLAHRDELLNQACAGLEDVWRSREDRATVLLVRLWGRNTRDALDRISDFHLPAHECVVLVSTPDTIAGILEKEERAPALRQAILERCLAVVVDEAHRAAAPTYVRIATALRRPEGPPCAMIGLTATPFRDTYSPTGGEAETLELKEIFGRLIVPKELGKDPQRVLVRRRVLARPTFVDVDTNVELDVEERVRKLLKKGRLSAEDEEAVDRLLAAEAIEHAPQRHERIFHATLEAANSPDARVLYFAPSVATAQLMAVSLMNRGLRAEAISGRTRHGTRRRLIEEFRAGTVRVLCNCEVLTTGFDEPRVTHVVMARPTVSLVLYQQVIGRGLRGPAFGGTETCVILNCIDRVKIGPVKLAYQAFRELWRGASLEA